MRRITNKIFKLLDKKQKNKVIILFFMMLLGGVMESLSISLIMPLMSAITNELGWRDDWYAKFICKVFNISEKQSYIKVLIIILILVFLIKNVYLVFEYYYQYSFIAKSRYQMQRQLMHSYTSMEYKYFLHSSSGEIIRIVTQDTNQTFALVSQMLLFYTELIVCIILGVTILIISPYIAVSLIVILLLEVLIIAKVIKPIMRENGNRQRNENAAANKWLLQSINGIKSIKVSNVESFFEENYSMHAGRAVNIDKLYQTLNAMPRFIIEAFTVVGVLILIMVMILAGMSVNSLIPALSAFMLAAIRLLPSVNRISSVVNQAPFYEGALDNILEALTGISDTVIDVSMMTKSDKIIFEHEISFNNVVFKYEGTDKKILDDASFVMLRGESIGVIGASGAGKTTVIDIFMGLLKPESGTVTVDGKDIEEGIKSWRSQLAYIPQTIFLIDSSIKENVAFGRDVKSEDGIWKALELAQMAEFVKSLPDGIETQIGEQGVRLSGGQRQRIGIARALYGNPELLVFDEATSALDNDTEAAIMDSIDRLRETKTIVLIAHRLSTLKNCNAVYEVADGKIKSTLGNS